MGVSGSAASLSPTEPTAALAPGLAVVFDLDLDLEPGLRLGLGLEPEPERERERERVFCTIGETEALRRVVVSSMLNDPAEALVCRRGLRSTNASPSGSEPISSSLDSLLYFDLRLDRVLEVEPELVRALVRAAAGVGGLRRPRAGSSFSGLWNGLSGEKWPDSRSKSTFLLALSFAPCRWKGEMSRCEPSRSTSMISRTGLVFILASRLAILVLCP